MTKDELEIKKFEFDQKIKLEEIALKKKELDLNIQERKSQRILAPIILSIIGGLITIITGIVLKHFENKAEIELENKKSQSALLIQVAETKNYDEFVNLLEAFKSSGFIDIDSNTIEQFKRKRLLSDFKRKQTQLYYETTSVISFLTVSNDYKSELYREKLSRFWQLYWVELSAVETKEVETAMVSFGNIITELEQANFKNLKEKQQELKLNGYKVAQVIKTALE
jgi:hypothetical protein